MTESQGYLEPKDRKVCGCAYCECWPIVSPNQIEMFPEEENPDAALDCDIAGDGDA